MSEFIQEYGPLLLQGLGATLIMMFVSTAFAYLIGVPLGVWLTITSQGSLRPNRTVNAILGWIVNIGRSIPFVILIVALIPFTRLITGTATGVNGVLVPLIIAAIPFVARLIENSLKEVPSGVIEAAESFGANDFQIIWKVMLHEALPSIMRSIPLAIITLFGYSAIAGVVGGGGLGDIAVRYGFQRGETTVMYVTIIISIILIQIIQSLGDLLTRKMDKRN